MKEESNFESIKNEVIEQLKAGNLLLGKDRAFTPLAENILNAALESEMDTHLTITEREHQLGNCRKERCKSKFKPH